MILKCLAFTALLAASPSWADDKPYEEVVTPLAAELSEAMSAHQMERAALLIQKIRFELPLNRAKSSVWVPNGVVGVTALYSTMLSVMDLAKLPQMQQGGGIRIGSVEISPLVQLAMMIGGLAIASKHIIDQHFRTELMGYQELGNEAIARALGKNVNAVRELFAKDDRLALERVQELQALPCEVMLTRESSKSSIF